MTRTNPSIHGVASDPPTSTGSRPTSSISRAATSLALGVVAAVDARGPRARRRVVHERREDGVEGLHVARLGDERGDLETRRPARDVVRRVDHDLSRERAGLGERVGHRGRRQREHDDVRALRSLRDRLAGRDLDVVPLVPPGRGESAPDATAADDADPHAGSRARVRLAAEVGFARASDRASREDRLRRPQLPRPRGGAGRRAPAGAAPLREVDDGAHRARASRS